MPHCSWSKKLLLIFPLLLLGPVATFQLWFPVPVQSQQSRAHPPAPTLDSYWGELGQCGDFLLRFSLLLSYAPQACCLLRDWSTQAGHAKVTPDGCKLQEYKIRCPLLIVFLGVGVNPGPTLPPACFIGAITWETENEINQAVQDEPDPWIGLPNSLFVPSSVCSQVLQ